MPPGCAASSKAPASFEHTQCTQTLWAKGLACYNCNESRLLDITRVCLVFPTIDCLLRCLRTIFREAEVAIEPCSNGCYSFKLVSGSLPKAPSQTYKVALLSVENFLAQELLD